MPLTSTNMNSNVDEVNTHNNGTSIMTSNRVNSLPYGLNQGTVNAELDKRMVEMLDIVNFDIKYLKLLVLLLVIVIICLCCVNMQLYRRVSHLEKSISLS